MSAETRSYLKGLFIGGLIGAVLGVLCAPKSGKETREELKKKTDELIAKTKGGYEYAVEHLKEMEAAAKHKVEDVEETVSEMTERGMGAFQDTKNRFKKAIEAGIEAYKNEKTKDV
jgi:gas vesicle protein